MSNPYLIALDLDGTLLTKENTISENTKKTLNIAKQMGHIICIATGRPYRSSAAYYQQLNLNSPIINFNGALVHHPLEKNFRHTHSPLDVKTARKIIEMCEAYQVHNIMVEITDDFYLRYHDERFINTFTLGQQPVNHGNLSQLVKDDPTSILVHPKEENVTSLKSALKDAHAEIVNPRMWGAPWHMIEIMRAGISKAVGLKQVAEYYQIPQERIIAFGDQDNDLEMIDYAGIGVAMENGIDKLKTIADVVTKSNQEDGIALFLNDLLGIKPT